MGRTSGSKNVSFDLQKAIVRGHQRGLTHKALAEQFNVSRTAITNIIKRYRLHGCVEIRKSSGRPKITSRLIDRNILRMSRSDPRLTTVDISRHLAEEDHIKVSDSTVRRRLKAVGLHGRRPVKKPLISAKNRKTRVNFAKKHINWTKQQWRDVLWSDESKFSLFGSDGISYVRRPIGKRYHQQYQIPTVKHGGGNVMVWGCFSGRGMGPLHRIDGIMDKNKYLDILETVMLPYTRGHLGRGFIFQQDNDPKHTSGVVQQWLTRKRVQVLEWPSQSPDLNPIEHLWEELSRRLKHRRARNSEEKFLQLKEEWEKIPDSVIETLIESMPRRCQAVIDSCGYPTKY